jgi:superfamily I DNA and/or RNA helicase
LLIAVNVQGDKRDVIFIGTVYGPERPGDPVAQRFGPIHGLAGKRRLNVLFSSAKQKIVTFSSKTSLARPSITPDDHLRSGYRSEPRTPIGIVDQSNPNTTR